VALETKIGLMRKIAIGAFVGLALGLLGIQNSRAQGTVTYVSNLGQPSSGSVSVGGNAWYAADFISGVNMAGYFLDSVQLQLTDPSGAPSGFTVMIYVGAAGLGAIYPSSSVGILAGSANPTTDGLYAYTPTSSLTLLPNTEYFVVLTSTTPVANGAYDWSTTGTGSPGFNSYHWVCETAFQSSSDGLNWNFTSANYGQFAINATAAPEPGVVGLLVAGGLVFGWRRWKARSV
jgi:hypothetical protein